MNGTRAIGSLGRSAQRVSAILVLGLVATLSACGASDDWPATRVVDAGGVSVLMETEPATGSFGGEGLLVRLAVLGGQCLGTHTKGGRSTLLLFPPGTTVSGSGKSLVIHTKGTDLHIGDDLEGGSRLSRRMPLSTWSSLVDQVPESCRRFRAQPFAP